MSSNLLGLYRNRSRDKSLNTGKDFPGIFTGCQAVGALAMGCQE